MPVGNDKALIGTAKNVSPVDLHNACIQIVYSFCAVVSSTVYNRCKPMSDGSCYRISS